MCSPGKGKGEGARGITNAKMHVHNKVHQPDEVYARVTYIIYVISRGEIPHFVGDPTIANGNIFARFCTTCFDNRIGGRGDDGTRAIRDHPTSRTFEITRPHDRDVSFRFRRSANGNGMLAEHPNVRRIPRVAHDNEANNSLRAGKLLTFNVIHLPIPPRPPRPSPLSLSPEYKWLVTARAVNVNIQRRRTHKRGVRFLILVNPACRVVPVLDRSRKHTGGNGSGNSLTNNRHVNAGKSQRRRDDGERKRERESGTGRLGRCLLKMGRWRT